MAIAFTARAGAYLNSDLSSYASASFSPTANSILIAFVQTSKATTAPIPVVSGFSASWTNAKNLATPGAGTGGTFRNLSMHWALMGASPGSGTIGMSATLATGCAWSVIEVTGADPTAPIVQTPSGVTTGDPNNQSITLAAAADSNNRPISAWCNPWQNTGTARTNWVEVHDVGGTSPSTELQTQYRVTAFETTASVTWGSTGDSGGIAAEIAVAGAAASLSPPPAPAMRRFQHLIVR